MADKMKVTVRMFIEAALQFTGWSCPDCNVKLEQVWIGDDLDPDLHYIHCPTCEKEFSILILFSPEEDIPRGA